MIESSAILIIAAIFLVAILYSSVGHGGASGYLAVMALLAVAPEITRPTALILNLFVASIAFVQFYRAKHFDWRIFLPFAAGSIPFAFIGGMIHLPTTVYKIILGVTLMLAAIRLAINLKSETEPRTPKIWVCLLIGALLGLVSGLVGVGGGIFLTPILLLMNWTETKKSRRNFCPVYSGQLYRRTFWKLRAGFEYSVSCLCLDNCGDYRRINRCDNGKLPV